MRLWLDSAGGVAGLRKYLDKYLQSESPGGLALGYDGEICEVFGHLAPREGGPVFDGVAAATPGELRLHPRAGGAGR